MQKPNASMLHAIQGLHLTCANHSLTEAALDFVVFLAALASNIRSLRLIRSLRGCHPASHFGTDSKLVNIAFPFSAMAWDMNLEVLCPWWWWCPSLCHKATHHRIQNAPGQGWNKKTSAQQIQQMHTGSHRKDKTKKWIKHAAKGPKWAWQGQGRQRAPRRPQTQRLHSFRARKGHTKCSGAAAKQGAGRHCRPWAPRRTQCTGAPREQTKAKHKSCSQRYLRQPQQSQGSQRTPRRPQTQSHCSQAAPMPGEEHQGDLIAQETENRLRSHRADLSLNKWGTSKTIRNPTTWRAGDTNPNPPPLPSDEGIGGGCGGTAFVWAWTLTISPKRCCCTFTTSVSCFICPINCEISWECFEQRHSCWP